MPESVWVQPLPADEAGEVDLTNEVRIEQSRRDLCTLHREFVRWVDERGRKDGLKQYVTQLDALKTQFTYVLGEILRALSDVSPNGPRGTVYETCRLFDRRTLWLRRLWAYFQTKFDQRDDDRWKELLAAADEVVWSCYTEPFRATGLPQGSSPLPYIASSYSPQMIPRSEPPQDLRSDVDAGFLAEMLGQLPVPVIGLPPTCVEDPWWMVYLAHEVGHHVQFDLLPDERLIDDFRTSLRNAAKASPAGADDALADRWAQWGEEIFADAFSLLTMGPWALWALAELVWTNDEGMLDEPSPRYPSPLVRLRLMADVLDQLGLDGAAALRGADIDSPLQEYERRLIHWMANAVVTTPLGTLGTLPMLCDWRAADFLATGIPGNSVQLWADTLCGRADAAVENTLKAARLVLSGGIAAWAEVSAIQDPKARTAARVALKGRLVPTIVQSREEVVRATTLEPGQALAAKAQRLADLLLRGDPARLRV